MESSRECYWRARASQWRGGGRYERHSRPSCCCHGPGESSFVILEKCLMDRERAVVRSGRFLPRNKLTFEALRPAQHVSRACRLISSSSASAADVASISGDLGSPTTKLSIDAYSDRDPLHDYAPARSRNLARFNSLQVSVRVRSYSGNS